MNLEDLSIFEPMGKIPRLNRSAIITEKLDGTNASIHITDAGEIKAASRTRWITPQNDNYGFAAWVEEHREELLTLGPGHHFGEWWGQGINRAYGLDHKRFSLFNVSRWNREIWEDNQRIASERKNPPPYVPFSAPPPCCGTVPVLYRGLFCTQAIRATLADVKNLGSAAAVGFMQPEGVVIYHEAAKQLFKVTLENDETPKSCN